MLKLLNVISLLLLLTQLLLFLRLRRIIPYMISVLLTLILALLILPPRPFISVQLCNSRSTDMFNQKSSHRPSVMTHQFSTIPKAEIPRSTFDRSHGYKTTLDAGYLIPFYVDEALPGDTFNLKTTALARLATPIFPIMDNMYMDTFYFSVPVRLLWDNWQKFNGEQKNPNDSTDYTIPSTSPQSTGYEIGSLSDYMGIPTGIHCNHSALWHRAYNLIWNEWFRDQNLQSSVPVPTDDGPDDQNNYTLLRRGKRHDYFTSALPWPQKGPGVQIPLGTQAPIIGLLSKGASTIAGSNWYDINSKELYPSANRIWNGEDFGDSNNVAFAEASPAGLNVYADLSQASAATINSLRQAFQIQKVFERDARGGTRYTELLKSHFGVTSPDARLQRPEYLGGGSSPVIISPIPQTSPTGTYANTPQGNLAAVGTVNINNHGFTSSFTEHCILIGLVSVRADLTYQNGLNRMWSRLTRFDYYWPALSHIGEQAVLQKEIYLSEDTTENDKVFGYQERYAEYRYKPSLITGLLRSSASQSLDSWHLSQNFVNAPILTDIFIQENPPLDRCIAVPSEPHFIFDSYIQMRCARPMPVYGVPGLIDHF
ncbi:MAG: major capsid protein [Microviridae sp.]|nr:MAG: major capsid protein [Microviridae sp.]